MTLNSTEVFGIFSGKDINIFDLTLSVKTGDVIIFDVKSQGDIWDGNVQTDAHIMATSISSVPEPTTIIAGALLLLPFAGSAIRKLRKT